MMVLSMAGALLVVVVECGGTQFLNAGSTAFASINSVNCSAMTDQSAVSVVFCPRGRQGIGVTLQLVPVC
jgi:hypothetical protein